MLIILLAKWFVAVELTDITQIWEDQRAKRKSNIVFCLRVKTEEIIKLYFHRKRQLFRKWSLCQKSLRQKSLS